MLTLTLGLLLQPVPTLSPQDVVERMKAAYRTTYSYSATIFAEGIVEGKRAWSIEFALNFVRPDSFNYVGAVNPDKTPFPLSLSATKEGVQVAAGTTVKNFPTIAAAQDQFPLAALIVGGLLGVTDKPFSPAILSPVPAARWKPRFSLPMIHSYLWMKGGPPRAHYQVKCVSEPGVGWRATDTATLWIDRETYRLRRMQMDFKGKDKPEDRFLMIIYEL